MISIRKRIIQTIDAQDLMSFEALLGELRDSGDADLDAFLDNKASALFLALTPPQDASPTCKRPSFDIINCLIKSGLLKGGVEFNGGSLSDYARTITAMDPRILPLILQFENDIRALKRKASQEKVSTQRPQDNKLRELATMRENAYAVELEKPILESYAKLHERYFGLRDYRYDNNFQNEVKADINAINVFAQKYLNAKDAANVSAMIQRIDSRTGGTAYTDITLSDGQTRHYLNYPMHACVWRALCDSDSSHFKVDVDMSAKGIQERKVFYLKTLGDAFVHFPPGSRAGQTTWEPMCQRNTRNICIGTLAEVHVDVKVNPEKHSRYSAIRQFAARSSAFLKDLAKNSRQDFWDVMYFYQLIDFPGGVDSTLGQDAPSRVRNLVSKARDSWIGELKRDDWLETNLDEREIRALINELREKMGGNDARVAGALIRRGMSVSPPSSSLSLSQRTEAMVSDAMASVKDKTICALEQPFQADEYAELEDGTL